MFKDINFLKKKIYIIQLRDWSARKGILENSAMFRKQSSASVFEFCWYDWISYIVFGSSVFDKNGHGPTIAFAFLHFFPLKYNVIDLATVKFEFL